MRGLERISTGKATGGGFQEINLLRRRWMRKRRFLQSLSPDPLAEGHPVDRDSFFLS